MIIYYFIFFVLTLLILLEFFNKKYSSINTWLITSFFIVFVGIRYGVGNDYFAYYDNYHGINNGTGTDSNEIFYVILNKLLPFEIVVFFFSFFSFFFLKKAIDYFSPRYGVISYLVFYSFFLITFEIHIIRQGLAISLILFGYKYLFNKRYLVFLFIIFLASTFHISALIVLPFIFIINLQFSTKFQGILLGLSFFIFYYQEELVLIYYNIATKIPLLNKYLLVYRQEERISYGISSGIILDLIILFILFLKLKEFNEKEIFLFRIYFLSVILTFVLALDPAALRLVYYFRVVIIFIIPLFLKYYRYYFFSLTIICLICLQYLITTFNVIGEYGRGDRNLKYYSIFNKSDYHK
jgi:hypothetical protein